MAGVFYEIPICLPEILVKELDLGWRQCGSLGCVRAAQSALQLIQKHQRIPRMRITKLSWHYHNPFPSLVLLSVVSKLFYSAELASFEAPLFPNPKNSFIFYLQLNPLIVIWLQWLISRVGALERLDGKGTFGWWQWLIVLFCFELLSEILIVSFDLKVIAE